MAGWELHASLSGEGGYFKEPMAPKRSPAPAPGKAAGKGRAKAKAKAQSSQSRNPPDFGLQYSSLGGFGPIQSIDFQSQDDSTVRDAVRSALSSLSLGVAGDDRGLAGTVNLIAITAIDMTIHPRGTDVPTTFLAGVQGRLTPSTPAFRLNGTGLDSARLSFQPQSSWVVLVDAHFLATTNLSRVPDGRWRANGCPLGLLMSLDENAFGIRANGAQWIIQLRIQYRVPNRDGLGLSNILLTLPYTPPRDAGDPTQEGITDAVRETRRITRAMREPPTTPSRRISTPVAAADRLAALTGEPAVRRIQFE